MKHFLTRLKHSLPVRLVARQIRRHKVLLLFWALLLGLLNGNIGESLGASQLFLSPEYLGHEDFWSVFITGSALGAFLFAYSITLYINESHRFHFIALTRHPFYTLAYNNFVIPGLFIGLYVYKFAGYHLAEGISWAAAEKITGLLTGIIVVFLISATYFFAERSIINRFGAKLQKGLAKAQGKQQRKALINQAREGLKSEQITDFYISFPFRIRMVNTHQREALREVVDRLAQQHGKLLLMQILIFLFIAVLGLLENNYVFQIPAGASFLLLFSMGIMMMGAVSFWFRKFGLVTLIVVVALFSVYNYSDLFREKHQAFGLDYAKAPLPYEESHLMQYNTDSLYHLDRARTLLALEAWKNRYQAEHGYHQLPRAVFVTSSGGGLRSALWTFNALQTLDSVSQGRLTDEIRLMTGASGGMFGQSYFRELLYRQQEGEEIAIRDVQYQENISQDLLNRLIFKMFTDLLMPNRQVQVGDHSYDWETGYSFEHQVSQNLPELKGRLMMDYAEAEAQGQIPQLIFTPTILNQTRQLFISATPVSYLTRPDHISDRFSTRSRGVEFRRMFDEVGAENLPMTTAMRMNASFPVFMPVIEMPTSPVMNVMDAGAIDNYGTTTLARYLSEFKEWFEQNTAGVVLVQVRDNGRIDPIRTNAQSRLGRLAMPLGEGYNSAVEAKDMAGEYLIEILSEWYDGPVDVIALEYPRETSDDPASLSWHLTLREKRNILQAIHTPANQQALQAVRELYGTQLLANK